MPTGSSIRVLGLVTMVGLLSLFGQAASAHHSVGFFTERASGTNDFSTSAPATSPSTTSATAVAPAPPPICFHDVREYEAVRSRLPVILRNREFFAIHDSFTLKGGIHIFEAGSRFVIQAKGHMLVFGSLDEDAKIRSLCLSGTAMSVVLDDGRSDQMTIQNNGIVFHDYLFTSVNAATYAQFMEDL